MMKMIRIATQYHGNIVLRTNQEPPKLTRCIPTKLYIIYSVWEYSRNPCPSRRRTFPNEVHHHGLGSMSPQAKCYPSPVDAHSWEMCDFHMGLL